MLAFDGDEKPIEISMDATVGDLKIRLAAVTEVAEASFHLYRNGRHASKTVLCSELIGYKLSMHELPPKQSSETNLKSKCRLGKIKNSKTLSQIATSTASIATSTVSIENKMDKLVEE